MEGEGNYGFCSGDCKKKELGQSIKLVDGTFDDAVVFADDSEVIFPPS